MARQRKLPSDEVLRAWRAEGLTYRQIHERLADQGITVSFSSVSVALSRMGSTDRVRYDDWLPWSPIKVEHNDAWEATMLRVGARLARGQEVPERHRISFQRWRADLQERNLVVAYEPERGFFLNNPRPGVDAPGGIPIRAPVGDSDRDPTEQ
jgi:hypothetical protein